MTRSIARHFDWHFTAPPERVWLAVADTARWNEAAGLPKYRVTETPRADGSIRFEGRSRFGLLNLVWEEVPVEWVRPRQFRHLRNFRNGPLASLDAALTLDADGKGGTQARYTVSTVWRNRALALVLAPPFLRGAGCGFVRLAAQVEAWIEGARARPFTLPKAAPAGALATKLAGLVARLDASPHGHGLAQRLADYVIEGQETDVTRIRPLALAEEWRVPERDAIELCLAATREGLLEASWDLLCPRCRGAKATAASLDRLPEAAHCGSCNVDYGRDFARNVELSFRPAAAIRPVPDGEFCLFGPMNTPHIALQAHLAPGEEREVAADLAPGEYRLRTQEQGGELELDWPGGGFPTLIAASGTVIAGPPAPAGRIRLHNREPYPRTLVIEERAWARHALTAHRVTTLQAFRDLFSATALRPGDAVSIARIALLFSDLKGSTGFYERAGDAVAYRVVRDHFAYLAAAVRRHDGALVKTIGDAVMAAFADPADAARAALDIQRNVAEFNRGEAEVARDAAIVIKLGLHVGAALAVTLNERLDYFGSTVNLAARLQGESAGGDIVLSEAMLDDAGVAAALSRLNLSRETATLKGFAAPVPFRRVPVPELIHTAHGPERAGH